jgi:hypothetical protein
MKKSSLFQPLHKLIVREEELLIEFGLIKVVKVVHNSLLLDA